MTLKDQLQDDVDDVFLDLDDFAVSVTYTNKAGANQIKAIVDYESVLTEQGKNVKLPARIHINSVDIASPKYLDEVTIDTKTFTVEKNISSSGNMFVLRLRRGQRTKFD
jgi:hypothetical protein